MLVADTNVLSELMRLRPAAEIAAWLARTTTDRVFTTSINQAEILIGIAILPAGRRRDDLARAAMQLFGIHFQRRILSFDSAAAEAFAHIVATRRKAGRPIEPMDAQIAAIAASRNATLVTRNVLDFINCGLTIINPWQP